VPADLIDNADRKVGEREAILSLSVLVGAIPWPQQTLTNAAAALKQRIPN
jgi:hypothetical protein